MGCIVQPTVSNRFICINCGHFLPALYEQYGESHIRLSLCDYCHNIADKYIEYDTVLLFLDLILIKPCAYRHTIYNVFLAPPIEPGVSLSRKNKKASQTHSNSHSHSHSQYASRGTRTALRPLVFRLGILMLLFEVYITWAYQEKSFMENSDHTSLIVSLVLRGPIQYIYYLSTTLLQNGLLCLCLAYFAMHWLPFRPAGNFDSRPRLAMSPPPSTVRTSTPTPTPRKPELTYRTLLVPPASGDVNMNVNWNSAWNPHSNSDSYSNSNPNSNTSSAISTPFPSRSPSPIGNRSVMQNLRIPSNHSRENLPLPRFPSRPQSTQGTRTPRLRDSTSELNGDRQAMESELYSSTISTPKFVRIFQLMLTTVLISNIIKLFPIVMLIWPYDPPILHATRFVVRIVHIFLLIEAVYIVFIDPRTAQSHNVNLLDFTARASKLVNPPTLAAVPLSRSLSNSSIFTNTVGNEPGIATIPPVPTSLSTSRTSNDQYDYYRVVAVVIAGEISRIILSHLLIVIMASSLWNVSIREVIIDDWKMLNLGVKMLEELGEYILGDAKKL